jgi:cytochrome b pre-mRNA-processing protein 3
MLSAVKSLFSPSPVKQQAYNMYVRVVEQSRKPVFYREWEIEDTLDGRFDVIVAHLFLIIARLEDEKNTQEFIRVLSEAFFADMDRSLREMGASDTGVGIRVKKMAQAFYGRLKAYKEAISDEAALALALGRNAYREKPVSREAVASMTAYMVRNRYTLQLLSVDALTSGDIGFCD